MNLIEICALLVALAVLVVLIVAFLASRRKKWDIISASKLERELASKLPLRTKISYGDFIGRGRPSPYANDEEEAEEKPFSDTFAFSYSTAVNYAYMYTTIIGIFNELGANTHVLDDEKVDLGFFKFQYAHDGKFIVTVQMCSSDTPGTNLCCIRFWKRWW